MKEKMAQLKKPFMDILSTILLTILFIFFITCETVRIEGHSMEPTLYHGDFIIAQKTNQVDLGQVVVLDGEMMSASLDTSSGDSSDLIKRVVALPGDTLIIRENRIYINGQKINDPFLSDMSRLADFSIELGMDEYFVLGDNRKVSLDSRAFGPVSTETIKGRALFRILSPAQWRMP